MLLALVFSIPTARCESGPDGRGRNPPLEDCSPRGHDNYRTDFAFAIDPSNTDVLYVGIEYKGVYKSVDRGRTWEKMNNGLKGYPKKENPAGVCIHEIAKIVIDPSNPRRVLLLRMDSPGTLKDWVTENSGLYESTDGGESWHQILADWMNAGGSIEGVAIDPSDPRTIYYGAGNQTASWGNADPNRHFVTRGILYKTTDGGKTWEELPTGLVSDVRCNAIFVDPETPGHLFLTTMAIVRGDTKKSRGMRQLGPMMSDDGGKTWTSLADRLPPDYQAIAGARVAGHHFSHIYLMTQNAGVPFKGFYSTNGGRVFLESPGAPFLAEFDPHDEFARHMLGVSYGGFLVESWDAGRAWERSGSLPKQLNQQNIVMELRPTNLVWDPKDPNVIYLTGGHGFVWRSEDKGKTWTTLLSVERLPD